MDGVEGIGIYSGPMSKMPTSTAKRLSLLYSNCFAWMLALVIGNGGCSDERGLASGETLSDSHLTWSEALDALKVANSANYSYLIQLSEDQSSPLSYGTTFMLGLRGQSVGCAEPKAQGIGDGWWLSFGVGDLEGGEYDNEWGRGTTTALPSERQVSVSLENRDGETVKRYAIFSAKLTIDEPAVEYANNSAAQNVTGRIHLVLPSTSVWEVECRGVVAVGESGTGRTVCDCLIDDERVVACGPESSSDICCRHVVPNDRVTFEIPFEAKPCAALCTYTSLVPPQLCEALWTSGFNDTSRP